MPASAGWVLNRLLLPNAIHPSAWRNCPKRVGGSCAVALRSTATVLLEPFWPPYASQIHAQSVARTPFRTVSPLDFSHLVAQETPSANGSMNALRLSSGWCARATRKKSLTFTDRFLV